MEIGRIKPGADYAGDKCRFTVWAPFQKELSLRLLTSDKPIPMERDNCGYWRIFVEGVSPGTRYLFCLDNDMERPDPASYFQPEGVHGPSEVVDHFFKWEDEGWTGIPLSDMVIYELHMGTFTREGTFDAAIKMIPYLKELGINALEIMPVAQFPGERNWGYDGAYPFAVQNSYGGPNGLKRLVNECHKSGISVILDVVYNHLGPEGNYFPDFGPYFTDKYKIPWGWAMNFDAPYSDDVRNYFIENALYWFENYHIDALRLDAVHGITDMSARPFLLELAERVGEFSIRKGRKFYLIAESDLNDPRMIRPAEAGGVGLDAQWNDDFHHSLHALITGEKKGYYEDFGTVEHLGKAIREGFVYSGQYSRFWKRRHGNSSIDRPASQFIVFSQSHDQVGNRAEGDRLSHTLSLEKLKLAAGAVILSPYIPLLFMGEEYGEPAPFQYFISHSDEELIRAVKEGRKKEFASFKWEGELPDPQAETAFLNSRLTVGLRNHGRHRVLFGFYKELLRLRREIPVLRNLDKESMEVKSYETSGNFRLTKMENQPHSHLNPLPEGDETYLYPPIQGEGQGGDGVRKKFSCGKKALYIRRWFENNEVFIFYNFSYDILKIESSIPEGTWESSSIHPPKSGEGMAA